ncbi:MAG: TlpA disulfide reductase family protein [Bryobacterales bacterium]|nr:TlpA disulfide reductase family protein [Bryobacterales bacterium]
MAEQLRQIKILVLIYAVAMISVSIGAFVYSSASFSLPAEYDHEPRESEAVAADDEAESVGLSENDALPSINLRDATGRVWTNSDLDGKAVLLNFWTTWCAPCRREMPIFDEMQEIYGPKGFTVLAVSFDRDGWDAVRPHLAEREFSYPVFVADESIERGFGRITSFPTTYFVRRDGTIETKHVGGLSRSHIVRHIESVLGIESAQRTDAADESSPPKMLDFIPFILERCQGERNGCRSLGPSFRSAAGGVSHRCGW